MSRILCTMLLLLLVPACAHPPQGGSEAAAPGAPEATAVVRGTGTVTHVTLEGGFWGILGDDRKQYEVSGLPDKLKKEGLRIRFEGRLRPDAVSTRMWGPVLEIVSASPL